MSDTKDHNAPAFAAFAILPDGRPFGQIGLTKRELIAATCMGHFKFGFTITPEDARSLARTSVVMADALLEELAK